ncbi:MAG TPA: cytochrome c oxidase subunit II [Candidatus Acidoferrales bacterium]|jgi:cytochrome c oxidase subunit 2|nr:cytochrome c oxidase subunit II [Candidatus Acidoferrales bacterium]
MRPAFQFLFPPGTPAVMCFGFPLHPAVASTIARGVDHLYFFLTALTLFFTILIFSFILYFMVKYRRRSDDEQPADVKTSMALEMTWTLIPTALCAVMFLWASSLYFENSRPPNASMEIFVIGKQWMWHLQHPEGPREINELHVPLGVPVKLTMTSEDVIHDFYIPAFRIKKDVLPGRYSSIWFEATQLGTFHLFCAQYCGAEHAAMIGWVYVMTPSDYAQWLSGGVKGESMAASGEKLFTQLGCVTCHVANNTGRCPSLVGLYNHTVALRDGRTLLADESYLRTAIVNPNSMPLPGYAPAMPSFQGQINEEQLLQLIAYIKSLGAEEKKSGEK